MDDKFRRPGQNGSSEATSSQETDWRSQLPAGIRDSIVSKLMDSMKNNLPLAREGGLELKNIAVRYEEMYYTSATCQNDYLGKICLKLMTMESKSKNLTADSPQSDAAASQDMQSHMQNQAQQKPGVPSQSNITSIAPNAAVTSGLASDQAVLSSNTDEQSGGSQQAVQKERHHQHPQPYVYNHQLQHLPLKRKLEEVITSQSFLQSQNLLQESQLQSFHRETPQPSLSQSSPLSRLNQLSSPLMRQHNSAHDANQIMMAPDQNILKLQKQQQASNQHYNLLGMHQQQLVPQNVSDFQQQMVGVQQAGLRVQTDPKLLTMLQKSKVSKQKQTQQTKPNLLPDQAQQTQHQQMPVIKSLPNQLYQGLGLQKSGIQLHEETQLSNQWINSPFEELTMIDQQSPLFQLQGTPKLPTSFTPSSQASFDGDDWFEEFMQKMSSSDGKDFPELSEIHQRIDAAELPQE